MRICALRTIMRGVAGAGIAASAAGADSAPRDCGTSAATLFAECSALLQDNSSTIINSVIAFLTGTSNTPLDA